MNVAIEMCRAFHLASSAGVGTLRTTQDLSGRTFRGPTRRAQALSWAGRNSSIAATIGWFNQHDKSEDCAMTIRWLTAGVAAALIVCSPSFAQDKASQKFLKEAIEGNLAEVKMGELAQKNGKSDKVRSFGQMLQKDHSDANQKATAAANQLGMSPPTEPNRKQKAMYDRMSKLSGDNFDREFAKHMVEDHKKDIKAYEKEAKKNDAAAAYAKEALPTLHKHLETAQSLSGTATSARP
jgi:putative membrane protein